MVDYRVALIDIPTKKRTMIRVVLRKVLEFSKSIKGRIVLVARWENRRIVACSAKNRVDESLVRSREILL